MRLSCTRLMMMIAALGALANCAQDRPSTSANASPTRSVLASSTPAAGSTVKGPLDALSLRFDPAARLTELTVAGPDGTMPMMITAVGETRDYSVPLPGLGAGNYSANWKASVGGQSRQGSFAFTVRD